MTEVFEDRVFERVYEDGYGLTYSDMVFRRCTFVNCDISITHDPRLRTTVRRVQLIDCVRKRDPAGIGCPIVEDCLIENLKIAELLQTWGAVFRHVTLRGKIGRIMISTGICPTSDTTPKTLHAFEEANAAYYAKVDWALDISEAEFVGCSIRGIPARLIRRDPETQVVVTRQKALQGRWRDLNFPDPLQLWAGWIDLFLSTEDPDVVLVAPKRARDFKELLRGLQLLREVGVAEPD